MMEKRKKTVSHQFGDMRVWWFPQLLKETFYVHVTSILEAAKLLRILANYDLFLWENKLRADFTNAGGLQVFVEHGFDGNPGWEDWSDEETGEDDPVAWIAIQPNFGKDSLEKS